MLLGWLLALGVVATVVYVTNAETGEGWEPWSVLQTSLYQAFSRPLWALAVSFIIFVCSVGQGGRPVCGLGWLGGGGGECVCVCVCVCECVRE